MNGGISKNQDIHIHYCVFHRQNTKACVSRDRNESEVSFLKEGSSFCTYWLNVNLTYNTKSFTVYLPGRAH